MKKLLKISKLLVLALMLSSILPLRAQTVFNDDTLDNPVPFDGGILLFGAAAIVYGLKKGYDNKRRDQF